MKTKTMEENITINNNNNAEDSSVVELNASREGVPGATLLQPVDRFDFYADAEVAYRETENGEEKRALISELFSMQKLSKRPVWLKLCAYDKYGYKVHAWRPCRFGLFGYVDVP